MVGRTIRIFLVDGTASGTRTAELGLSTIKALVVPRASLSAAMQRPEPQKTGVYVLVGEDSDSPTLKRIYIGEGDLISGRIATHNRDPDKDFWDEVVLLVSKDDNLTKAHVRFVEAKLIALAKAARRSVVTNGTEPSEQGKLPEPDEVEMGEFIEQARLLLGALGYDIFEPVRTPILVDEAESISILRKGDSKAADAAPKFRFGGQNFDATMEVDLVAGKFVVMAGSRANKTEVPSLQQSYKNLRAQLIRSGVLQSIDENSYKFVQDYAFSAATPAAQVVCGNTANGRGAWKVEGTNISFAEWQDRQLPSEVNG